MAATGIGVLDIEFVRVTSEIKVASLEPFFAAGAELGAKYVITSPYDPDLGRLAERLAEISDVASQHGLRAVLEFFPWTVVPDLDTALRMVEAAERPEFEILVNTLHFNRSASRVEQLDEIPAARLPFVHVCDAPVQDSFTTVSILHPEQIAKMRELGISPSFLIGHVRWWGKAFRDRILGPERARFYDPCASALKGGLRISLHSGWNVSPLQPLRYVADAANRIMNEGGGVFFADERIPVEAALRAVTIDAAWQCPEADPAL